MRHFRGFFVLALIAVFSFAFNIEVSKAENVKDYKDRNRIEKIIIPAILPLTGPSADLGQSVANGMRLALEEMNAIHPKYKFELVIEPTQSCSIFPPLK